MQQPKVLLLDERTVGGDPQSRMLLLERVRAQADAGLCVLYTTHYMDEAEKLCDQLAIVDHGRLIAEGKLDELRAMLEERDILRLSGNFDARAASAALSALPGVGEVKADESSITLDLVKAGTRLPELFAAVSNTGGEIRETTLTQPSLESLFIKLTGRELRE